MRNLQMIIRYGISILVITLLASCSGTDREKATDYLEEFSDVIVPYKEGTERIILEVQSLLQKQLKASGHLKLSSEDSLRQRELLKELETLAHTTVDDIRQLEDLPGSDLKESGIKYVQASVDAILGAYNAISVPMEDMHQPPDQQVIDSLSQKFSDDLTNAVDEFADSQMRFIEKFELLSN